MAAQSYIPTFYFYTFANAIASPYTSLDAYRNGLIDASGNITGNEGSFDPFEYFIFRLKKIFDQLPPGSTKSKLTNVIGVMQLFSEEAENFGITKDQFNCLMEAYVTNITDGETSYFELLEDMAVGAIGGAGAIGSPAEAPGANKGGVSGFDPKLGDMFRRDTPVNMVSAVELFSVPSEEFKAMKVSKTYIKTPTGNYIRRFGHRNPDKTLGVRDEESGEIFWLPKANKKTFVEQYGLQNLHILNEDDNDLVTDILNNTKDKEVTPKRLRSALEAAYERAQKGRTREAAETVVRRAGKTNSDPDNVDPESIPLGAEASETAGGYVDLVASMPHLAKLMKTSPGTRFAADFFGGYLHTAGRENSNDPTKLDSMRLIDRDDPMWGLVGANKIELPDTEIGILGVNQRAERATGPVLMSPEKIIELPGAPAEDIEEYSRILRTGESDPAAKDRIERFMQGQEGLGLRRRTLVRSIQDKNLPVQVMYQGRKNNRPRTAIPFFASPEGQISSVMGRSGRFRLGKTGKIPHVMPQYLAQQPEAGLLKNQPGTFWPVYAGNRELISALKNWGIDPSEQFERITGVLSGRVGSNYRDIMRKILSRKVNPE